MYFGAAPRLCDASPPTPQAMKPVANLTDAEFIRLTRQAVEALPDVPASLQRLAIQAFQPETFLRALGGVAASAWRGAVAVLSFDSWAGPALAHGMRSSAAGTRHLMFSANGRALDLRIAPAAASFTLAGQILGPEAPALVELVTENESGHHSRVVTLNSLGEFHIGDVRRGDYRLTLFVGADRIVLPTFQIGDRAH